LVSRSTAGRRIVELFGLGIFFVGVVRISRGFGRDTTSAGCSRRQERVLSYVLVPITLEISLRRLVELVGRAVGFPPLAAQCRQSTSRFDGHLRGHHLGVVPIGAPPGNGPGQVGVIWAVLRGRTRS